VRIEQLAPFPHEALKKVLSVYGPNTEFYWVQEEHENFGAWNYLYPRLNLLLGKKVGFYGRPSSASTAVGMLKLHRMEEEHLLSQIFG
jgi:2-oxoglutarate dehydrogenase complex dehydrogenase (E1) component-like enzyme